MQEIKFKTEQFLRLTKCPVMDKNSFDMFALLEPLGASLELYMLANSNSFSVNFNHLSIPARAGAACSGTGANEYKQFTLDLSIAHNCRRKHDNSKSTRGVNSGNCECFPGAGGLKTLFHDCTEATSSTHVSRTLSLFYTAPRGRISEQEGQRKHKQEWQTTIQVRRISQRKNTGNGERMMKNGLLFSQK